MFGFFKKTKLQLLLLLIVFSSASMADTEKYDFSLTNEQFSKIVCEARKGVWDGKVCLEENKGLTIDEYCTVKGTSDEYVISDSAKEMLRSTVIRSYSQSVKINIKDQGEGYCSATIGSFPDLMDSISMDNGSYSTHDYAPRKTWWERYHQCYWDKSTVNIYSDKDAYNMIHKIEVKIDRNSGVINLFSDKTIKPSGYAKRIEASGICPGLVKESSNKKNVTNTNPSTLNKIPKKGKDYSSGTGFYINKKGLMITNNHVVKSCNKIKVDGSSAVVKSFDTTNDLALLQVESSPSSVPYFRSGKGIRLGDGVTVAGYPLRSVLGSGLNVVTGTVASLSGVKNNSSRLQITAPINSGNSGGPLFDSSGRVVGVIVSKINNTKAREVLGEEIQGANFAIKGSVVRSFLDMNDVDYEVSSSNKNMSTADIAENAKEYTALIKCWK